MKLLYFFLFVMATAVKIISCNADCNVLQESLCNARCSFTLNTAYICQSSNDILGYTCGCDSKSNQDAPKTGASA